VLLLHYLAIPAEAGQLRHRLGSSLPAGSADLLRLVKGLPVKAREVRSAPERLERTPLPAIARGRDGAFFVLAKLNGAHILIHDPTIGRPELLDAAGLAARWDGTLILLTRRAGLSDFARRFDIAWFLSAVVKYRGILSEVLVASFFLQLFGLILPLFFQVVTDKVLVHRGLSTLDVLVLGLVAVSVFETILAGLRTYLFAHTTNRIDVELGARLYRHLLALPVAYHQTRTTGVTVARVRELENIRQFLTGSALTVVLDLFFYGGVSDRDVCVLAEPDLGCTGQLTTVLSMQFVGDTGAEAAA